MTDAIQLVPFDEDSYYQDPLGFFARLRESRPVAPVRIPGYGRAWIDTAAHVPGWTGQDSGSCGVTPVGVQVPPRPRAAGDGRIQSANQPRRNG